MCAAMNWLMFYIAFMVSLILLTVTIQNHNNDASDILLDSDFSAYRSL